MASPDNSDSWAALANELGVEPKDTVTLEINFTEDTTLGEFFAEAETIGFDVEAGIGVNPVASLRGWTRNIHIADTEPMLKIMQERFGYTPDTLREFLSRSVPVVVEAASATENDDGPPRIEVHPSTGILDFRNMMAALGIPLSAIANHKMARSIEQYQGPQYGNANTPLLAFLHQRGYTLNHLQQALEHVVPVVKANPPFGKKTRRRRRAL